MKILIISNIFPPGFIGGYELGALDMTRGLIANGHTVEVLTSDQFTDDDDVLNFPVHRVLQCGGITRSEADRELLASTQAYIISANLRHLISTLIAFHPDRILCFNIAFIGAAGLLNYLVALGYQPVIFLMDGVFDGYVANSHDRAMFEKSFGNPHWLERTTGIFMSNNLRTSVQRDFPVVGNTIVPGWFHPDLVGSRVPRDPGQPDAPTRFIFASQVTGHKGINILLDAARMLLDQGATNFTVDIVGNGEVSQMLHRLAALGLQNNVQYLGLLSKEVLLTRFAQYDALVLPTWPREPFGFVIGEAAAAGCVPVMTTGIGASEWFLDGIDSLKISQTPTGAATAMLRLMSMPVPERDRMRGRARATATRFFKFKTALASVETVLQNAKSAASLSRADTSVMRALGSSLDVLTNVWSKSLRG